MMDQLANALVWWLVVVSPEGSQKPIASYDSRDACQSAASAAVGSSSSEGNTFSCKDATTISGHTAFGIGPATIAPTGHTFLGLRWFQIP